MVTLLSSGAGAGPSSPHVLSVYGSWGCPAPVAWGIVCPKNQVAQGGPGGPCPIAVHVGLPLNCKLWKHWQLLSEIVVYLRLYYAHYLKVMIDLTSLFIVTAAIQWWAAIKFTRIVLALGSSCQKMQRSIFSFKKDFQYFWQGVLWYFSSASLRLWLFTLIQDEHVSKNSISWDGNPMSGPALLLVCFAWSHAFRKVIYSIYFIWM